MSKAINKIIQKKMKIKNYNHLLDKIKKIIIIFHLMEERITLNIQMEKTKIFLIKKLKEFLKYIKIY